MELWNKWMEYCQLVALVGLPVLERLLYGDQLRGLQGVQILAFQMPVITRNRLLSKSQHEHTDEQRTNQGHMQMEIGSKSVEQKH